jgi:hypothetical protein
MTAALLVLAFVAGWILRGALDLRRHRRRRGGYVRRVPMASVHPREPKP